MRKVLLKLVGILRFVAISLAIDVALFLLVTLSCVLGSQCTNVTYSERMFWVGMAALLIGLPAVFASLGSFQGQFGDPFLAGQQMKVADAVIKDARLHMSKRARFAWRFLTIGVGGIAIAALIDILG
ncbi:MAG: hypothetical protein ACP5JG_09395 [Anaerolineae bacterium]